MKAVFDKLYKSFNGLLPHMAGACCPTARAATTQNRDKAGRQRDEIADELRRSCRMLRRMMDGENNAG
jgi:hypothetical protein